MSIGDYLYYYSSSGGIVGATIRIILRFFQFVFAITVAGLYGVDLAAADKLDRYADSKWIYAEVVAGLSAITVLVYAVPFFRSYWAFAWDWVLFILWTAVFGVFGRMYIPANPTPEQSGQRRMQNAVWIDLVNMLLWLITAIYSTVIFFRGRSGMTMHTGRAHV